MKAIKWERWKSPIDELNEDRANRKISDDEMNKYEDDEDEFYDDEYNEDVKPFKHPGSVIYTNFGVIPIPSSQETNAKFSFWIGHFSFNITQEVSDIIEKVPGVEILEVFSRYRLRVGIGQHPIFKEEAVLKAIESAVCIEEGGKPRQTILDETIEALQNKFINENSKDWFIFVLPNNEVFGYNNKGEDALQYQKRLKFFRKLSKNISGKFYESS